MSTFKCINPKSYKLTMNNTYEVLEDLGDSIRIINDNNKVANYHKSLFDEVITEPEPVPEIPVRTEQDLIDSITFLNDDQIMFIDLQNNKVVIGNLLMAYDTSISCGILQIAGINNTIENIEMLVDTSKESLIKLKQEIFKLFIISIIEAHDSVLYFLLSTNDISDYEDYHAVLDDLSEGSFGWEENPNSGNDIKLWVLHQDVAYW